MMMMVMRRMRRRRSREWNDLLQNERVLSQSSWISLHTEDRRRNEEDNTKHKELSHLPMHLHTNLHGQPDGRDDRGIFVDPARKDLLLLLLLMMMLKEMMMKERKKMKMMMKERKKMMMKKKKNSPWTRTPSTSSHPHPNKNQEEEESRSTSAKSPALTSFPVAVNEEKDASHPKSLPKSITR